MPRRKGSDMAKEPILFEPLSFFGGTLAGLMVQGLGFNIWETLGTYVAWMLAVMAINHLTNLWDNHGATPPESKEQT